MSKILISIDERDFSKIPFDGSIVQIRTLEAPHLASVGGEMNSEGLIKYSKLLAEYNCDALGCSIGEKTDFSLIKNKSSYLELSLSGNNMEYFDPNQFIGFNNIRSLTLATGRWHFTPFDLFPNLEFIEISDWRENQFSCVDNRWPKLKGISIDNYSGDFSEFLYSGIQTIFLSNPIDILLEGLVRLKSLNTIVLSDVDKNLDCHQFGKFKFLQNLNIESNKEIELNFESNSLLNLAVSNIQSIEELKKFHNLKFYQILKVLSDPKMGMQTKGDLEQGNPFNSMLGPTFFE